MSSSLRKSSKIKRNHRLQSHDLTILIPIILYYCINYLTMMSARSQGVIMVAGKPLPISALTGVFSSLGNICLIVMVLFYKKTGFIISIVIMLIQFPVYIINLVRDHTLMSIPGFFTGVFTIIMIMIIYLKQHRLEEEEKRMRHLFEQTATALVNAIDAKDRYTHGHSARVADYSRKIAELAGKNAQECEEIYYAALLHDVGKIGVLRSIINKPGKLTKEEYEMIKQHPAMGAMILEKISEYPYLSIGAHWHHERFDGGGYPDGLKGEDIPEIARIISVADAYDAMSSLRSYRDPIPQDKVREEIVKYAGTQFDPGFARMMIRLIDEDAEYDMKERSEAGGLFDDGGFAVGEHRSVIGPGILITSFMTTIKLSVASDDEPTGVVPSPSMVLFDSLDGIVHSKEKEVEELLYFEYGEVWFDGRTVTGGARKIQSTSRENISNDVHKGEYRIEAVRVKDHARVVITGENLVTDTIIALPDSTRYMYIGLTGEHCRINGLNIVKGDKKSSDDYIPRIAEEISYIKDCPVGDMPNLQIDGVRTAASKGIAIKDGLSITFHAKSLPTARLVWHCPYVDIFSSEDGIVNGKNYRELALMRLDGECRECDPSVSVRLSVEKNSAFKGWEEWKDYNRNGFECTIAFGVSGNAVTIRTENAGVAVEDVITLTKVEKTVYAAITGDQCAITNIRLRG